MSSVSKEKKPKADRHRKPLLALRLDADLIGALKRLSIQNRRTMTTEAAIALEEYLQKHGKWPPPGPAGAGP